MRSVRFTSIRDAPLLATNVARRGVRSLFQEPSVLANAPYRLWQLRAVADKVGSRHRPRRLVDITGDGELDRLGRDFAPLRAKRPPQAVLAVTHVTMSG